MEKRPIYSIVSVVADMADIAGQKRTLSAGVQRTDRTSLLGDVRLSGNPGSRKGVSTLSLRPTKRNCGIPATFLPVSRYQHRLSAREPQGIIRPFEPHNILNLMGAKGNPIIYRQDTGRGYRSMWPLCATSTPGIGPIPRSASPSRRLYLAAPGGPDHGLTRGLDRPGTPGGIPPQLSELSIDTVLFRCAQFKRAVNPLSAPYPTDALTTEARWNQ